MSQTFFIIALIQFTHSITISSLIQFTHSITISSLIQFTHSITISSLSAFTHSGYNINLESKIISNNALSYSGRPTKGERETQEPRLPQCTLRPKASQEPGYLKTKGKPIPQENSIHLLNEVALRISNFWMKACRDFHEKFTIAHHDMSNK